jgi:SagB-type dehydrogenase family enzyme
MEFSLDSQELKMKGNREFLKDDLWAEWEKDVSDQKKGLPPPPVEKSCPDDAVLIDLVPPEDFTLGQMPVIDAIRSRRSRREYSQALLTLDELSFLLWATQGASKIGSGPKDVLWRGTALLRTVPSGGARHPFETYLLIRRVEGLDLGLYRYLPLEHKLLFQAEYDSLKGKMNRAWGSRNMFTECAVTFIWTVIPYRTEWRYTIVSPKIIAQDSGHVCQNLYLACESIGAGTCAVGAYDQKMLDDLVGVDGEEEFVIYLAPVGKIK